MASYRDLWTQVLAEMSDQNQLSISTNILIQLTELCLFILQICVRAQTKTVSVTYPSDVILSAFEFVPVFNVHSFVDLATDVALEDFILMLSVRDANGKELSHGSLKILRSLPAIWSTALAPRDYYMIFSNLLCVRQRPTADTPLSLTYIHYIKVDRLEEEWPLQAHHIHPMQQLMRLFIAIRAGHYQLATTLFERFLQYVNK